jgi:hypothetical protein
MATSTLQGGIIKNLDMHISRPSIFTKFFNWCEAQQENRLFWLGIALTGHGCIITPLTVYAVLLAGNSLLMFMLAIVSMGIAVVTNLAALPTKITIPALVFTVLLDLGIIAASAIMVYFPS